MPQYHLGETVTRKVVLDRSQIRKGVLYSHELRVTAGDDTPALARPFAPSWTMVMGYKRKQITISQYLAQYKAQLEKVGVTAHRRLYEFGVASGGRITFLCFCRDIAFCHTHHLIQHIVGHDLYSKGFTVHPDMVEWIEGLDWEGECWIKHYTG